ncbi:hypothetical protein ACFL6C_10620, partial [Myxococcota bacterium]
MNRFWVSPQDQRFLRMGNEVAIGNGLLLAPLPDALKAVLEPETEKLIGNPIDGARLHSALFVPHRPGLTADGAWRKLAVGLSLLRVSRTNSMAESVLYDMAQDGDKWKTGVVFTAVGTGHIAYAAPPPDPMATSLDVSPFGDQDVRNASLLVDRHDKVCDKGSPPRLAGALRFYELAHRIRDLFARLLLFHTAAEALLLAERPHAKAKFFKERARLFLKPDDLSLAATAGGLEGLVRARNDIAHESWLKRR